MQTWFVSQMDFIYFVYGLGFFLLFAICVSLRKSRLTQAPWHWLALFGLIHGLHEWAEMLALNLGDNAAFQWVRLALMTASFLCLLEFGRSTCQRLSVLVVGRWIGVLLVILAGLGSVAGLAGLQAGVRYALGFTGALCSAAALVKLAGQNTRGRHSLYAVAAGLLAYAFAAGFVVPFAGFFPSSEINNDAFLRFAGFPVQLLRAALACLIAFFIWHYNQTTSSSEDKRGHGLGARAFVFVSAGLFLLLLSAGWLLVNRTGAQAVERQRSGILHLTQQVAIAVDAQQVQSLFGSGQDVASSTYQYLKKELQALRKVAPGIRFVYLMRKVDGRVIFLVDSETLGSKDESPPGQVFDEASVELVQVFSSGQSVVDGPVADRWGVWVSGYAPLTDDRTGEPVAVLGIDKDAHEYMHAIASERLKAIVFVGLLCIVAILALIYYRRFIDALEQGEVSDAFLRWGMLCLVMIFGLTLTALVYILERDRELGTLQTVFLQRASGRVSIMTQSLALQLDRLDGVSRFFSNAIAIDRAQFKQYVRPMTEDVPVQAIEWIPRVRHAERAAYETRARQAGFAKFEINEKDAGGKVVAAGDREEYFPVYFVEPLPGNEAALGFDLASSPVRRAAMEKSRDEGRAVATEPVQLVQAAGDKTGFLVFVPVYANGAVPETVEQRRHDLRGYILGVYRGRSFLKGLYFKMPAEGLACLIEDPGASPESRVLYRHQMRIGTVDWKRVSLRYEVPLLVAEREWRMTIVPGSGFLAANLSRAYFWIPPVGILLTALLAMFLNMLMMGRYRLEWVVRQRTRELNKEKESLAKSEERFRHIAEGTGDFIWEVDQDGLYTYASPMVEKIYGYTPAELVGNKYLYDLLHPQERDQMEQSLRAGFASKQVFRDFIKSIVHRSGQKVLLSTNAMPVLDEQGNLTGYRGLDRDITEARNAEEALRKREAYLSSILDNFPYLVWLKDFDGRFLAVNSIFARACGRSVSEVIGKNDFEIWPSEMAQRYCADDVRVIRGRIKTVVEEPIAQPNGTRYFETYKSPILDREGRVIGTTGFSHDITERKIAEQAMRASEERYRLIASAITDYIYTVFIENGRAARTTYNPACLAVTGYSAEEFLTDNMLWIKVVVEEDRPIVSQQIEQIMSGQKDVAPVEHRIMHKDGHVCWVKNTIVLHYDAQGRLVSYDGLISDISARREAEKILEDQKRALDEHAIVSKADSSGLITYVNDQFCQISKYTREELLGQSHSIVNSGYHPKAFFVNLWCTVSSGQVWRGQIRNRAKDGTYYWVQSTIVPFLDEHGRVKEYISARTDITQSVENEERLERAMQVKTNFVSTVSHELRTPLASIKSSIDILNTEVPGQLTADQKIFLSRVKANIDRLARLINDVLDLSKLESGKMVMNLIPLRPDELLKDVTESHGLLAKNKGLDLALECAPGLPLLLADRDRLTQVLNNLINNALKFTKQGQVSVSVACEGRKTMTFCVRDTGDGIQEEDLPKLFQKFQQVGGASHQVSGTGLGLAICKEIVERHGGRIWVESRFGEGSAFFFDIPVRHDKRVLIVDDDRGTVELIKGILQGTDKYEIEVAFDGFMAGQKYQEFSPNLVIMDIGLPKLSGLEACNNIKSDPRTMHTKVLMLSSFTAETEKRSWEAGADDLLAKPVHPKELLHKVGSLI
ncbi:MAG: PAS domain S-box protein [Candidatus Omnitrophica bacterium]|nr:PAS domain S-box protein [Candidatus Omnitrophota bacterium]